MSSKDSEKILNKSEKNQKSLASTRMSKLSSFYDYCERNVQNKSRMRGQPFPQVRSASGVGTWLGYATGVFIGEILSAPFERLKILQQVRNVQHWVMPKQNLSNNKGIIGALNSIQHTRNKLLKH